MEDWWVGVLYRLVGWGSYRLLMGQGIRFWLVYLVLAGSDWWVAGEGGLWHRVLSYDTWWGCLILDRGWRVVWLHLVGRLFDFGLWVGVFDACW